MEGKVGFGFRPNDEELVGHYLRNKIEGNTNLIEGAISEVNICNFDPWNLRFQSKYKSRDPMWYFFSRRENKYGSGNRQSRTTSSGFWKVTGEPVDVKDHWGNWCEIQGTKIGHKRVLVFLKGRSSEKSKSDWVMHEFHYELLPEHQRTYVICRLEYKGNDRSILSANATDPTPAFVPNMTNSAGSVVNQPHQGHSGSYNTYSEYDSANQGHQSNGNFNYLPEYDSANQSQQFGGQLTMQQSVQGYSESFNPFPQYDSANPDQWLSDYGQQQANSYSASYEDELRKIWNPLVQENYDSLVDERISMRQNYSDYRPKKPVTGVFADDSSDSEAGSMIFEDTSSSTDSVGSSNEPDHTPIDDVPSLSTMEPLPKNEAQEQPMQLNLQSEKKVTKTQKSECEWKMAEDSFMKTPSTNAVKQSWIVLEKRSQRTAQWNYLKKMIIGVLLFISIIGWIILVGLNGQI